MGSLWRTADLDIDVGKGAELSPQIPLTSNISYNGTTQPCMQEHRNSNVIRTRQNSSKQAITRVEIYRHF